MNQDKPTPESAKSPIQLPTLLYPPRFRLGEIYTVDEFLANIEVAEKTFNEWQEAGLKPFRPHTRKNYVLTDAVVNIWEKIANGK